jgi:hypothetical protein
MRIHTFALLALPLLGCAPTAHERLGDVARYAPAFAGYVVGSGDETVILRDPVTYEKIRCREDLERVAPAVAAAVEDEVHDRHARAVADGALAPLTLVGRAGATLGEGLLFPAAAITVAPLSPGRRERYVRARELFLAGRFDAARDAFMGVIVAQDGLTVLPQPWIEQTVYYLGVCDDKLHRTRDAAEELRRFLMASPTPDEERYRDAERRLARIEPGALATCRSQEPLALGWRRSP